MRATRQITMVLASATLGLATGTTLMVAQPASGGSSQVVVNATGEPQEVDVPAGVCGADLVLEGAGGGVGTGTVDRGGGFFDGGDGGRITTTISVVPSETLQVNVGVGGEGGSSGGAGGGGGGATDVRRGAFGLADRLGVAGGGGGGGGSAGAPTGTGGEGGDGGGASTPNGSAGGAGVSSAGASEGGGGGTTSAGGAAGVGTTSNGSAGSPGEGADGTIGVGGAGGFNGGGDASAEGAGGGGYFGGGSGGLSTSAAGGGGGGSSFGPAGSLYEQASNAGADGDAQAGEGNPGGDGTASINWVVCAEITVTKVVVNTGGGTKQVADFDLFANGTPVTSGEPSEVTAGTVTVTETADPDYDASFSGDCDASGVVEIEPDGTAECTITNVYDPAPEPPAARAAEVQPAFTG